MNKSKICTFIDIDKNTNKNSEEYRITKNIFKTSEDNEESYYSKFSKNFEDEEKYFYEAIKCFTGNNDTDNERSRENEFLNEINLKKETEFKSKSEKKITAYDLALEIKEKNNIIINEDKIYIYEEKQGYYRWVSDYEFQQFIRKVLKNDIKRKINTGLLIEAIKWIKTFDQLRRQINNNMRYINFINGYYDLGTKNFYKEDRKELYFGYFVNAQYKRKNVDGYNFKKYINSITQGNYELEMLLQEIIGVALSNIRGFKKAIFIIGCANSGKSTFLELINNLIGAQFISNLSMEDLNDKFRLAELEGKRINTCGEISETSLKKLDIFKKLTGGDTIIVEKKCEAPFYLNNMAMLLFAGNYLPNLSVTDSSNAFFKRIILVPFNNSIPEEEKDINLMEKLLEERNFIIKYAIEGVSRFIENNYTFTSCGEAEDIKKEYLYENASIQMFLEENCIFEARARITSNELINAYEEFCYDKQVNPMSDKALHKHIRNLPKVKRTRFRCKDGNLYGYIGIRLNY